jgi:predicted enzyme related to lactoylglutathione lyase
MTSAPPRRTGTVVWVDLSTSDVEGAIHLYERLLRWR